ncbi:hypothetical protein U1Q18_020087 [Sarracenia purpurea var. burkii]
MVERRKPLLLSSTKALIDSALSSSRTQENHGIGPSRSSGDDSSPSLLLAAGILRFPKDRSEIADPKVASLDHSALVGLPISVLKKLSITSGSLFAIILVVEPLEHRLSPFILTTVNSDLDLAEFL